MSSLEGEGDGCCWSVLDKSNEATDPSLVGVLAEEVEVLLVVVVPAVQALFGRGVVSRLLLLPLPSFSYHVTNIREVLVFVVKWVFYDLSHV